jgi:acetylornithine deacetylase
VLQSVRECEWPSESFFGQTTCNIGVIAGGTRPNVIAAQAQAELQIRLVTDMEKIKRLVAAAVSGRARIDYSSAHNPVSLFAVDGFEQCVVRFTTDIPYLSNWGQSLLLGPGSILNAHTEHEQIAKHELEAAVELYVKLVKQCLELPEK